MKIEIVNPIEARTDAQGAKHLAPVLCYESVYWRRGQFGMRRHTYNKPLIKKAKDGYSYFLTGFVPRIRRQFPSATITTEFTEPIEKFTTPTLNGITFRPDQFKLMAHAIAHKRGIIKSPTGSGKSLLQLGIISAMPKDFSCLILAHTKDIVTQTYNELCKFGFKAKTQIIMEGHRPPLTKPIVIATVQTFSGYSVDDYMTYFDMVMIDECFAKDTKVQTVDGKKSIQKIKVGDLVGSSQGWQKVLNVFVEKISLKNVLKINLNNSKSIVCSSNHLFFSKGRWIKARNLKPKQVLTDFQSCNMMSNITSNDWRSTDAKLQFARNSMSYLSRMVQTILHKAKILQQGLFVQGSRKNANLVRDNEKNKSGQTRNLVRKNENKKPNDGPKNTFKNDKHQKNKWNFTHFFWGSWGQWTSNALTKIISNCFRLVYGSCDTIGGEIRKIPNLLQSRYWQQRFKISHRNRWQRSQLETKKNERHQKNAKTKRIRVESVEIYEQGSNDQSFRGVIEDQERNQGFIELYDLQIEKAHDYFVEGVLVHNSHHTSSLSTGHYYQVLSTLLAPYRFGFTATTSPNKEAQMAAEGLLGPVVANLSINDAATLNIIATPKLRLIKLPENHNIRQTCRSYDEVVKHGIVGSVARTEKICNLVQNGVKHGKVTLVMVNQIEHGNKIQAELKARGVDVPFVQGVTDGLERVRIKEKLIAKKLLAAICTSIWKEGVNIPSIDVIVLAHLGKSELVTLQSIGRGLRRTDDKEKVSIIDFFDPSHTLLIKHFGERLCLYMSEGWI